VGLLRRAGRWKVTDLDKHLDRFNACGKHEAAREVAA
jgi:hypothetical protein